MIQTSSLEEARKLIDKASKESREVVVLGREIEFNRKILENKKVNILVLNLKQGKDKLKERDSGLNQVLCKIAWDNNITLAIDFHELLEKDKKEKAKILSRLKQNIMLAKKYKNKLRIINLPQDKLSVSSLLLTLGADTKLAKEAAP